MNNITLTVDKTQNEIKVDCDCGSTFYVTGNIPAVTKCDYCEQYISLYVPLTLMKEESE